MASVDRKYLRGLSTDELDALSSGDETELNTHSEGFWKSAKDSFSGIGENMLDMSSSGITGGFLRLAGLPNDLVNIGSQLLTGEDAVEGGGQKYVDWAKKHGLIYEKEDPNFMHRFNRGISESASTAALGGIVIKSFADMLKAGKYVPQTAKAAKSVWQRIMTDAADNPELLKQEIKAGLSAGTAVGTVRAVNPDAPWWVEALAEIGGGSIGSREKLLSAGARGPGVMSSEGQQDTVVDVLSTLHGSTPEGLDSAIAKGKMALLDDSGRPRVQNFEPTTGQVAVREELLPDDSKMVTRPLNQYTRSITSGDSNIQAKLEGQSRAIQSEVDKTLGSGPGVSEYPLETSQAGRLIREDLQRKKDLKRKDVEEAYNRIDEGVTGPMHRLFDEGVKILDSMTEADDAADMPVEVKKFMDTFRKKWPDDSMRNGSPFSFDDFIKLRADALKNRDMALISETEQYLGRLNPEKEFGLLKRWRTKAMESLEDAKGMLKLRLGQFKSGLERAIESFGDVDPNAPPGTQSQKELFRDASRQNRELMSTFNEGPVGDVLEMNMNRYQLPESDIPGKFVSSSKQPESWNALLNAAKDPSDATRAARRVLQQRFKLSTTNNPQTPEAEPSVSSSKMRTFLDNPDNRELITGAYGKEHYDRLKELEEFARLRESILSSPGVGGSNTREKLAALEKLNAGKELDRFFASLTLRLGFIARAGRAGTQAAYSKANESMDKLFYDSLIDPGYLQDLLSKSLTRAGQRARTRYRSYLSDMPGDWADSLSRDSEENKPGYAKGGAVTLKPIDLSSLAAADTEAMKLGAKWLS